MARKLNGSNSENYTALVASLKQRIRAARLRASISVNQELIQLYWGIGRDILAKQQEDGWGARVIERLAVDLRRDFPEMTGLSARNLGYMKAFAEAYPDPKFLQQVVAKLPWGHNVRLLEAVKNPLQRKWYAEQAIEHGWSRNVLVHQIEGALFQRQGKAVTNFSRTLPAEQSELAQQLIKDPYNFDFLSLGADMLERELERGLLENLRATILELGKGFAFVGSQYHIEVGDQDYYLDLLFYHLRLRCFVVIDLKMEEFKPEFAGKMNFYLTAVDDQLRHASDASTIGIILCKGRNEVIVEYALRESNRPMGVAAYKLSTSLPDRLRDELPTLEEIARDFPAFALVRLRIEIERAVRSLLHGMDEDLSVSGSLNESLQTLKRLGKAPESTESLLKVLRHMHAAAHGAETTQAETDEAMQVGTKFLKELE
jgi:predicted nuclease of restriction endonuclease-like (RecB) superfamily